MESNKATLESWRLVLPFIWMAVIFWASRDLLSTARTAELIIPVLHSLWPSLSPHALDLMHTLLRKSAHLLEYLLLSYFWIWSLRPRWPLGRVAILLAFSLSLAYACFDELHQSFVPSRGATMWDVVIDGSGAFLALGIIWLGSLRPSPPSGGSSPNGRA